MFLYFIFIMVSFLLFLISWFLVDLGIYYDESLSSFECGFMSFSGFSGSFSLHFFLISIIFLIFDVEIVLILPLPIMFGKLVLFEEMIVMLFFILMVLGGLYFEWWFGSLDWVY
uniref:NADH-ubiquinone oxidoreductase chain 3 n=1 Tax=Epanerchodus koreanus TaxID=2678661 RepID=A0A7L8HYY5_9MYRI|nr:NADH dehydrogenase subunit 3 [Epanerchodus koreanus]QOE55895.1 NADH dehydrogenase subunit 3 [Epanerchodus koreanus]